MAKRGKREGRRKRRKRKQKVRSQVMLSSFGCLIEKKAKWLIQINVIVDHEDEDWIKFKS